VNFGRFLVILRDRVHKLWWSHFMRFGDSVSPTGAPAFGDEQRVVCVFSTFGIMVAGLMCPGGNYDATLSPVQLQPSPLLPLIRGGDSAAGGKMCSFLAYPPLRMQLPHFCRKNAPTFLPPQPKTSQGGGVSDAGNFSAAVNKNQRCPERCGAI
jgi:hypothetical protein